MAKIFIKLFIEYYVYAYSMYSVIILDSKAYFQSTIWRMVIAALGI
jgi:hypothetical protein